MGGAHFVSFLLFLIFYHDIEHSRLWQLSSSLTPFLSTLVNNLTAFALPRRMGNACLLFLFPWLSLNCMEGKRRVNLVQMSKWEERLGLCSGKEGSISGERKCAEETGPRSAFWKKLSRITLMPHSSRNGLPSASAGWALYFYSVNSHGKLRMKMLDHV